MMDNQPIAESVNIDAPAAAAAAAAATVMVVG